VNFEHDRLATSVVIVNFRTNELTVEAARSALSEPEVREVIVVENGSGDRSGDFLRAALPATTVRIVDAGSNLGFGRAVNLAVPTATCGLIFLLNSDATVVPGAVATLGGALLRDEAVGLVAPAVHEADLRTHQAGAYGRFPRPVEFPISRTRPDALTPDWVSGVAMMFRKDDFSGLGGFDPDFEMYFEDIDLCRRMASHGKHVIREPSAHVLHRGGQSWASSVDQRDRYHRSKIVYFRKQGARTTTVVLLQVLRVARVWAAKAGVRWAKPAVGRRRRG
jgi:GT2 family glycosyltransferase